MILTGPEIRRRVLQGEIEIEPFNEDQLNPASYDLRLGTKASRYRSRLLTSHENNDGLFVTGEKFDSLYRFLDSKAECEVETIDMGPRGILMLHPGILYLMHTEEIVCAHDCVPIVDGKSSIGRLGISVHQTAGFGDPGFRGQYTLEVTVVHPVIVYAGMRFCQIRFHQVVGEIKKYDGNYVGEASMGPVPSRSWKQFEEKIK